MPKYRLSIERNDAIIEIDWSILLEKEKSELAHDLLGIDRFTTLFVDSNDLKNYLYTKGIIDDVRGKMCIVYRNNGQDKKIAYGIVYKKDKEFLKRINITEYICARIDEKDIIFLQRLINKYESNPIHKNDIVLFKNFIEKIRNNRLTKDDIEYLKEKMINFVNKEAFKYDNVTKRYILNNDGMPTLKYKTFRELGKLCSNYHYRVYEKLDEPTIDEVVKVKTLDKKQCPGQLSFID